MNIPWKPAMPWAAVALVLVAAFASYTAQQRKIGRSEALAATADSLLGVQAVKLDSLAKAYRVDTVRLTKWLTKWDSVPVEHWLHDTVPGAPDTIRIPVQVLVTADSTIRSCKAVLRDCEAQKAALAADTLIWKGKYDVEARLVPSAAKPWFDRTVGGLVGFGLASLLQSLKR